MIIKLKLSLLIELKESKTRSLNIINSRILQLLQMNEELARSPLTM